MLLKSQVVFLLLISVNVYFFFKKGHPFLPHTIFWCILSQSLTHLEASGAGEHAVVAADHVDMYPVILHGICPLWWRFLGPSSFLIIGLRKAAQRK